MTAMAPSPTAEATRLADSARASPATNNAGNAGLQVIGRPVQFPAARAVTLDRKVRAGHHKTTLIPHNDTIQPVGQWRCADEQENPLRADRLCRPRGGVAQCQALHGAVAARLACL